jgi:1-deoxy-D-xylulose-5-phosphate synthase
MAPADEYDLAQMLDLALRRDGPCAVRYPKAAVFSIEGNRAPVSLGKSETLSWSDEGVILCYGALLPACLEAARLLRRDGINVGVINARFAKPLDREIALHAVRECSFVVTVEEGALMAGFGSAVLETAVDAGLDTSHVRRIGIPDRFIEHAERGELLADLGLDAAGIATTCRNLAAHSKSATLPSDAGAPVVSMSQLPYGD